MALNKIDLLIAGAHFDAQNEDHKNVVTKAALEATGMSLDDMVKVQHLVKAKGSLDEAYNDLNMTAVMDTMAKSTDLLTRAVNALEQSASQSRKADNHLACDQEMSVHAKTFGGREKIPTDVLAKMASEYGLLATELATKSLYERVVNSPVSKSDPLYDKKRQAQKLNDLAIVVGAISGNVHKKSKNSPDDIVEEYGMAPAEFDGFMKKVAATSNGELSYNEANEILFKDNGFLNGSEASYGAEHVPVIPSEQLITQIWMKTVMGGLIPRIPMTGRKMSFPAIQGRGRSYKATSSTDSQKYWSTIVKASSPTTNDVDFEAQVLARLITFDSDYEADTLYVLATQLYDEVLRSQAYGIDDIGLNGSVSLTDHDNAAAEGSKAFNNATEVDEYRRADGAIDARTIADGLRKIAFASSATVDFSNAVNASDGGAATLANFTSLIGKLGVYGQNLPELRLVTGLLAGLQLLMCDKFLTYDKMGLQATLVAGMQGSILDIPVARAEAAYDYLGASGVYTGLTPGHASARGTYVLFHPMGFRWGDRSSLQLFSGSNDMSQRKFLMAKQRLDFRRWLVSGRSNECPVAVGYNCKVA